MRIGIDARVLQVERRGQGQYAYYLIKNLLELDMNNEYVLFYNSLKGGEFVFNIHIPNLRQIWCRIPGRILKKFWSYLAWPYIELLTGPIDVLHHTMNYNMTHFTPLPTHRKMVATFHGIAFPELLSAAYTYKDLKEWAKAIASSASIIIAVSRMAKENFLQYVSFPEERIRIIYLAAHESFKLITDKELLERALTVYNLNDKEYILYVGGGEANKNLKKLLRAFSVINEKRDLYLVLVSGINPTFFKNEIKGIENNVIFFGHLSHSELVYLYNGARLFVLPTFYESFGLPVLEAMACGTPVVASKNTGALEVVGDAALIFDPENVEEMAVSIKTVLQDEGLRASLREKGIEMTRHLSWRKTARETLRVYRDVYETLD